MSQIFNCSTAIIEYNTNTGSNLIPMFCSCISHSDQVETSNSLLLLYMELKDRNVSYMYIL